MIRLSHYVTLGLLVILPAAFATVNVSGIYGIVERRMPQHAGKFTFEDIDGEGDAFTVSDTASQEGSITVSCTTTSACARGLYAYAYIYLHHLFN